MYDDLKQYNDKPTDNTEYDKVMLNVQYNNLTKHFNEIYEMYRENCSFIAKMDETYGTDEKRFIDVIGNILSETGHAKNIIEEILKSK